MTIRLVSWNVAGHDLLGELRGLGADVALVQEAPLPSLGDALQVVPADPNTWWTVGWEKQPRKRRTAVIRLSDRVEFDPRPTVAVDAVTGESYLRVSHTARSRQLTSRLAAGQRSRRCPSTPYG